MFMYKSQHLTRLFDFAYYQLKNYPQKNCFVIKKQSVWTSVSTQEYIEQANKVSRSLINLGIKPGDKIAIITTVNQPKWHILDLGIMQIGAISVPLYPTFSLKDIAYTINHSDSLHCFVSDDELYQKVASIKGQTQLKQVFSFEEFGSDYDWEAFLKYDNPNLQAQVTVLKNKVISSDLATIIYTSGTTGTPKGVMLSHQNIASNVFAVGATININSNNKRVISYLPICHIFERANSYYCLYKGFEIHFAESIDKFGDNIKEIQPHFIAVVPRLLEKIYDKIIHKGSALTGNKKKIFWWALRLGERFVPYQKQGWWYAIQLAIARKLVFSKWKEALGGHLEFMLSGSAPMQPRIIKVFSAAGIPVLEGYGLTETSPAISVSSIKDNALKIGYVGKVLDNVQVKIAEDGEILVKGPNVMLGYYKDPEKTAAAIKEGFFHTGDIGELDSENFLKITDRKKEIFKTSGGKYIAPATIETMLKKSIYIEQIMVIGEGKKMPAALIQVSSDQIANWAKKNAILKRNTKTYKEAIAQLIQNEINHYNKYFGKWEQIKKFEITPDEWTVEAGHLTPTLKVKRRVILEKYKHLYDKIYNS